MWSRLGLGMEMKIGNEQCNIAVGGMAVQEDLPLHCELVLTSEPSILSLKSVKVVQCGKRCGERVSTICWYKLPSSHHYRPAGLFPIQP